MSDEQKLPVTRLPITEPPKSRFSDIAHASARALLGSIPDYGAAAAELFNQVVTPPLEKRRNEWFSSLAEALADLQQRVDGFRIENLVGNEAFVSVVLQATQCALRAHQHEKREALRNAVLNTALPSAPEDNLVFLFLSLVDAITPWHLQLLALFSTGEGLWTGGDGPGCIGEAIPGLSGRPEIRDVVIRDLETRGLIYATGPDGNIDTSSQHPFRAGITDLGSQFLKFITSPIND